MLCTSIVPLKNPVYLPPSRVVDFVLLMISELFLIRNFCLLRRYVEATELLVFMIH